MRIAVVNGGVGYPLTSLPYPLLEKSLKVILNPNWSGAIESLTLNSSCMSRRHSPLQRLRQPRSPSSASIAAFSPPSRFDVIVWSLVFSLLHTGSLPWLVPCCSVYLSKGLGTFCLGADVLILQLSSSVLSLSTASWMWLYSG